MPTYNHKNTKVQSIRLWIENGQEAIDFGWHAYDGVSSHGAVKLSSWVWSEISSDQRGFKAVFKRISAVTRVDDLLDRLRGIIDRSGCIAASVNYQGNEVVLQCGKEGKVEYNVHASTDYLAVLAEDDANISAGQIQRIGIQKEHVELEIKGEKGKYLISNNSHTKFLPALQNNDQAGFERLLYIKVKVTKAGKALSKKEAAPVLKLFENEFLDKKWQYAVDAIAAKKETDVIVAQGKRR